jgi:hypothetical protein
MIHTSLTEVGWLTPILVTSKSKGWFDSRAHTSSPPAALDFFLQPKKR